ncbi:HPF/RaiA family ribosome-associated protein [Arhodomonas sp. SL1]|uniref:HPF/RaiA family ribosome-associated protein n=1 Tax=Arhodomonas sp. SL1 TaxID=3425691 RepID=UPI003F88112F
MELQVNPAEGIETSAALEDHIRAKLAGVERRFGDRITRVEAYLKDVNAGKGGVDTACTLEAHPAGLQPVVVEADATDAYTASHEAARKLEKALAHRFAKADGPRR